MKHIYLWFYCLPIWEAILILLFATAVFLHLRNRFDGSAGWKCAVCCLLALWLLAMLWATLADRSLDPSGNRISLMPLASYLALLRGGNPEILRGNLMNGILFYPAGLFLEALLPERWSRRRKLLMILMACGAMSICIEAIQYWLVAGLAETDDVIHNTFGGAAGMGMSWYVDEQKHRSL